MQTLERTPQWELSQLTKYLLLVAGCLLLWFLPFTHTACKNIDKLAAIWLNQSLLYSRPWQLLWGYLNHPNETWINIIFMIGVNFIGIFTLPKCARPRAFAITVYCWLLFQFVLLFTHKVFADWIEVQRDSPSIVITPWVILSQILHIDNIKVYSHSCFPAGHVLVLIFWAKFIALYSKPWVRVLAVITAIVLTLPRVFSGAHWISDILFTIAYSTLWFYIAVGTPLYTYAINLFEAIISNSFTRSNRIAGAA